MGQRVRQRNRAGWAASAVGLWLLAAPFVLGYPRYHPYLRATADDLAVGTAVLVLGTLAARRGDRAPGAVRGLGVCGLWLFAAPAVLGLRGGPLRPALVNDVVCATVLLGVTLLAALLAGRPAPGHAYPDDDPSRVYPRVVHR